MAIAGGGGSNILNSPLLWAIFGLKAAEGGVDIYKGFADRNRQSFVEQSLIEGKSVSETEGGPFRRLASKVTGGAISPYSTANAEDIRQEMLALQGQQAKTIDTASKMTKMRQELGPTPFQKSGPFAQAGAAFGLNIPQTPGEQQRQLQDQLKLQANEIKVQDQEIKLLGLKQKQKGQKESEFYHSLGYVSSAAGARATAAAIAKQNALGSTPLGHYPQWTFRDPHTLANMSAANPKMTINEAEEHGYVPIKDTQVNRQFDDDIKAVRVLDNLEKLIPKVFPIAGSPTQLKARGLYNDIHYKSDPNLVKFYAGISGLISYIRAAQGRYPSMAEIRLGQAFWPDPGSTYGSSGGWLDRFHLPTQSDTQAGAYAKIKSLRQQILDAAQGAIGGAGIDTADSSTDSAIDSELGEP